MIRVIKYEEYEPVKVKSINTDLESLQKEIGGYIEIVSPHSTEDLFKNLVVICDEEGRVKDRSITVAVQNIGAIYGNAIIANEDENGDLTSLTDKQIRALSIY